MNATDPHLRQIVESYFGETLDDALHARFEPVRLAGGNWLFRHGDPGDSLYFLVRGRLQVWDEGIRDNRDSSRLLGEVVPGESVGEVGLLSGAARSAGIRAIRDSLLLKMDRSQFVDVARDHPALVMKLAANIAQLVQRGTSRTAASARRLSTISILPLSDTETTRAFCRQLVSSLDGLGDTLALSKDNLEQHGAPVSSLDRAESAPGALLDWLHDQENLHRFLVYTCDGENTSWTRLAIRQSDIVLYIGEAGNSPGPHHWERELMEACGSPVARPTLVLLQPGDGSPIQGTAAWLEARRPDFHLHVRQGIADDINKVARIIAGRATGLVLAGGAARGIAHLGVYKAMLELGIRPDWIGGTSIGSIFGAGMAMDLDIDSALEAARNAMVTEKPFSDFTLPLISLTRGRRMDRVLGEFFRENIEDLPISYFCVSCMLDDGGLNVHESGPLPVALRASASMPGIFPPAVVDGRLTVDGSVINNLPVDVMRRKPVGRVIAVDLSSQKTYKVSYRSMPSPWAVLRGQLLPFTRTHRVPRLMTTLLKSTELGTLAWVQEQGKQADLLLHPPVRKFGVTEVKAFDRMVEVSYRYAIEELARWQTEND